MTKKNIDWKKVIHGICIFIIAIWWLHSCQNSRQPPGSVTVHYGSYDFKEVDILLDNGEYEKAVELCLDKLEDIRKDSDSGMQLYTMIGEIYGSYIGDKDQAVSYLEQAITVARKNQNWTGMADACYCMLKVYVNQGGNIEDGLEYAREAEEIYRNTVGENTVETANVMYNRGKLYYENSQWKEALENFESAVRIYELNQDLTGYIYNYMGVTWANLEEDDKAIDAFLKAQKISDDLNEEYSCAHASQWLGGFYEERKDYDAAIDNYYRAVDYFITDERYLDMEVYAYKHLAHCVKMSSGRWQDGIKYAILACQAAEEAEMSTEKEMEDQRECKRILKEKYYNEWKPEATDEEFEIWYQRVVLDGEDWEEG